MKKLFYLLICLILAACGSQKSADISSGASKTTVSKPRVTLQSILSETDKGKYVQGELLVKFRSGTAKASAQKAHQTAGATVIQRLKIVPDVERVRLSNGLSVKDAITQYMSNPDVEYAEPNYIRKVVSTEVVPSDLYFRDQWALRNTGQYAYGTAGADINATEAWRVSTGSYDITIAVLDTGVDYNHNDLASNMWRNLSECNGVSGVDDDNNGFIDDCAGWDFVSCEDFSNCPLPGTGDNDPMDEYGHGTHVAGIIGAVGNNQTGVAGVMWRSRILPVRALNQNGEGSDLDIAAGIAYAVQMGAKVINASWGGYASSQTEMDAVSDANAKGVLFVAAAGNDSNNNDLNPAYPASYPFGNIISVAATDQNDLRVPFSNFGYSTVDVGAPGVYIISTVPTWMADSYGYGYLEQFSGTSMAAPHVTGLAGLLYSYYYNFDYTQIRNMILSYVNLNPSLDGWVSSRGRISASRSMFALCEPYDLTLNRTSALQINLSWTDIATEESNYLVERKEEGGAYVLVATLGQNANAYTESSNFKDGTKYYYRLRLKNWIGESPGVHENERSIITVLNPPTHLSASALSNTQISLNWVDNSNSESGSKIFRHGNDASFVQVGLTGPNVSTFVDSGLNTATKYWYEVRAYNAVAGDSDPSDIVAVTTLTSSGHKSGGGGGGCSIGAKQNVPTSFADASVMLLPFLVIVALRRRNY